MLEDCIAVEAKIGSAALAGIDFLKTNQNGYELRAQNMNGVIALEVCKKEKHVCHVDMTEVYAQLTPENIALQVYSEAMTSIRQLLKAVKSDKNGKMSFDELSSFYRLVSKVSENTTNTLCEIYPYGVAQICHVTDNGEIEGDFDS